MNITSQGEELILDKERALFLPKHQLLAISDLHLGKSAHFRRAGLQVPATIAQTDLQRLSLLIKQYHPKTLLINGDMFHHGLNTDIDEFSAWRKQYQELNFLLVKGNHDKLSDANYAAMDIEIHEPSFCLGPFCFIHDAPNGTREELYPISGHIHPGVTIVGKAKQRLRFPCFFFGNEYAVLPAFSLFTGLYNIYPKASERIFAVTPKSVLEV
ncbi:ligase-associated DNA damage response endonuclease PdeM [Pedobacter riviphilus]|uniref:Ligase-associated DNA damage response endonuclease PdeM n=1 Tax=Pedobacter riviphilus TaxID=2766984 RepID=A0ABX6TPE4_9SPHI|nr:MULTISPECIES: ligase-associated DNA damage response endonuclease PdeM [Pedobacter]NII82952.1 DNA ligase-associated metallophosphoesterase [Pedobacter sp. SG908]NMN36970.1 DNA ligase-associated metallophosphoesterase [Pedobacter sp. SG918]QNR86622.1 ligase-associated DNA damage response endonuclease PdeM [Pedobacter riviphilus]